VLTAGPRSAADQVTVTWEQVAEQRAHWFGVPGGTGSGVTMTRVATTPMRPAGPARAGLPLSPLVPQPPTAATGNPAGVSGTVRRAMRLGSSRTPGSGQIPGEFARRALQRFELLELLALGPAFQFRLSGTVTAAWASADRAEDRAGHWPELAAALTGRLAPAAEAWLGIDPDAVTVAPHEGSGWGTIQATGTGRDQRLRASLPMSWLSDVWACGLAAVDGHLVVAVEEPGFPRARVLALRAPDAVPVQLDVTAAGAVPDSADALPRWSATRAS
jgi:hypothetical protein